MAKKKNEGKTTSEAGSGGLFDKALDMLNTQHGNGIMESLTAFIEKPVVGTSTGSLSLDYIINPKAGGMPKGKIIDFYGPFSSGKTTLALGICANAVANNEKVIYIDAEGSLDPGLVVNAGIPNNSGLFHVTTHIDARLVANSVEVLMKTGEVGVVVIDSVPTFKPLMEPKKGEDDVDFTRPKMAFQASFLSDTIPHLAKIARQNNVILVLLNQIRNNLSGYGAGTIPFGGKIIEHMDSVRLRLSGKVQSVGDRISDEEGNIVGQYTTCVADKNKTSIPMQEAKLPIYLGKGVNPYMELAYLAQKVGLVDGAAGRFKWADSGEPLAHGINQFTQKLYDDFDLYWGLRLKVIEKLGICYDPNRKVVNAFHDETGKLRDLR